MQTFIIWIASVICLMIRIPQVYGATAFNSDNDEDPMEADDGPYAGLGKRRRNPNTRPLVKAVMNQQHKRRTAEQEMPISIAPSFKRKRESMDEEMPQAKRLMADTEDGECKAETEYFNALKGTYRAKLCRIENSGDPLLVYHTEENDGSYSYLGLGCGRVEYYIDEDGISEVQIDGASYIVDIADPFRDFHQKAFQMTDNDDGVKGIMMNGDLYDSKLPDPRTDSTTRAFGMPCREIFRDLQREILGLQAGDVLEKEKCTKIITSICETYEHAVGEPVKVVTYDGPPATP
ncbi:hypothetical protein FOZ63_026703 [Perkinsus olseni]|uniref:Uncharacterized protein n=1 Tax=Perkinsus olseni TaxID=32597 RepID=A0A7J6QK58_PEROL|nr:hypothetical protein FOZ63_026703 [Perkinsus olseni]KAF4745589.1 hypothetical protein FOZ62_016926 [Perkinsus olseni]